MSQKVDRPFVTWTTHELETTLRLAEDVDCTPLVVALEAEQYARLRSADAHDIWERVANS